MPSASGLRQIFPRHTIKKDEGVFPANMAQN
jgi:hypothetical protein